MISIWQILFIVLVVALVWLYQRRPARPTRPTSLRRRPVAFRETVRCVRCGTFVPRAQAVEDGRGWYCCEEHRRLDAPRRSSGH